MKKILMFFLLFIPVMAYAASDAQYMAQGKKYYAAKNYGGALDAYANAIKANPKNYEAWAMRAYCYVALKDTKLAIYCLENSLRIKNNPALRKYMEKLKTMVPKSGPIYYDGSYARSEALGGATLALRDSSSAFDIYGGALMAGGLAQRQKKSFTSSDAGYNSTYWKQTYDPTGWREDMMSGIFAGGNPNYNYDLITYWLTGQDALAGRALYGNLNYSVLYEGMDDAIVVPMSAIVIDAVYSRLIMPEFSAGVSAGYSAYGSEVDEDNDNFAPVGKMSKINWEISGVFAPKLQGGLELKAGLGVGNMYSPVDMRMKKILEPFAIDEPEDDAMLAHEEDVSITVFGTTKSETTSYTDYSGIKIQLASSLKAGALEVFAKLGTTAGLSSKESAKQVVTTPLGSTTTEIDPYDAVRNGSRISAQLKAAFTLSIVELVAGLDFVSLGNDYYDSEADTEPTKNAVSYTGVIIGGCLKSTTLTVPLELHYRAGTQETSGDDWKDTDDSSVIGALAGLEYMVTKEVALRIGADIFLRENSWRNIVGTIISESEKPGTENNPQQGTLGVSAGGGYKHNNMQYDLRVRYVINSMTPVPTGLTAVDSSGLEIGLSAKVEI